MVKTNHALSNSAQGFNQNLPRVTTVCANTKRKLTFWLLRIHRKSGPISFCKTNSKKIVEKQIWPRESTANNVSIEWPRRRILSANSIELALLKNNLHLNIFYFMFQQNVKISSRMNANISRPMKDTVTIGKNTWRSGVHSLVDFVNMRLLQVKKKNCSVNIWQ